MIRTAVLDADDGPAGLDLGGAEPWQVLVLSDGRPADRVDLPGLGAVADDALAQAALVRRADAERARSALIESLRRRIGAAPPSCRTSSRIPGGSATSSEAPALAPGLSASLSISVVVCTHRRGRYLPDLLASLARLDPAPAEVVVVDNDPGEEDCRALVEAAGFRYVLEPRRGLDNARNAGIRAARGKVVAFTDDDCVVSPGWLRSLPRTFAPESVLAATGPAFPHRLDTPARVRMENQASLARGFRRVAFDWQVVSPLHAAAMGVGANMAIRRRSLLALGDAPFPPELDAGTETESGGDTYLLSRLLADGGRVVYEPEMFVFHQHRPDGAALRRAVLGYGIGLSASLSKLVAEERELTAPRAWAWLVKQYLKTQRRRAVGRADAVETRLAWDYLRGGFLGTGRWRESLRTQRAAVRAQLTEPREGADGGQGAAGAPAPEPIAGGAPAAAISAPGAAPELSVVVPTFRREADLRRLLDGLRGQTVAGERFEVLVVDDDPDGREARIAADAGAAEPFGLRRLANPCDGAAAARNHGAGAAAAPLLLFLDDDVVPDPRLLEEHLAWHASGEGGGVLVGAYRPRPERPGFCAQVARLWWQDFFDRLAEAREITFVGALTANMSVRREILDRVGDFSEEYARARREDWEWGLRARRAGVRIGFERAASARHHFTLGTAQRLRDARREGFGDALIAASYPEALPSLPIDQLRPVTPRRPLRWLGLWLWRRPTTQRLTIALLDLLERGNLREAWLRLFRLAQSAAYAEGVYAGGGTPRGDAAGSPTLDVELSDEAPLPAPEVGTPVLRATLAGVEVGRIHPADGVWAPSIAEQLVDSLEPDDVARAAAALAAPTAEEPAPSRAGKVEAIFGPASDADDLAGREKLEALGVAVRVATGPPSSHWEAVAAAARAGERPLVALPMPGTRPGPAWLADALAAFSGERVGLAFGGAIPAGDPAEPLYLHDAGSADASLCLSGRAPAYLFLRRELLGAVEGEGMVEPVVAAVAAALREGWAIGHRDARGLRPPSYGAGERGEAFGLVEARTLVGGDGSAATRLARGAARGVLTLAWLTLRRRGRLSAEQRAMAGGVLRGSGRGVLGGLTRP
jgi:GT2 family glycosyltransferase